MSAGTTNVETLQLLRALEEGTADRVPTVQALRVELLDLIDQLSDARSLLAGLLASPSDVPTRVAVRTHLNAALDWRGGALPAPRVLRPAAPPPPRPSAREELLSLGCQRRTAGLNEGGEVEDVPPSWHGPDGARLPHEHGGRWFGWYTYTDRRDDSAWRPYPITSSDPYGHTWEWATEDEALEAWRDLRDWWLS